MKEMIILTNKNVFCNEHPIYPFIIFMSLLMALLLKVFFPQYLFDLADNIVLDFFLNIIALAHIILSAIWLKELTINIYRFLLYKTSQLRRNRIKIKEIINKQYIFTEADDTWPRR